MINKLFNKKEYEYSHKYIKPVLVGYISIILLYVSLFLNLIFNTMYGTMNEWQGELLGIITVIAGILYFYFFFKMKIRYKMLKVHFIITGIALMVFFVLHELIFYQIY